MPATSRRQRAGPDIWPGFVDALATLLIIIIFLLMVFTLAQHYLSQILSGRDEALAQLNRQVAELADLLALERDSSTELRREMSQISAELQSSIAARDRISSQLAEMMPERDALKSALAESAAENERLLADLATRDDERDRLNARLGELRGRADSVSRELEDANKVVAADRGKIELQLRELEGLRRDIGALRTVRAALEKKVADMAASLQTSNQELTAARDRTKELAASLSTEQERTALAQREIEAREVRLRELGGRADSVAAELSEEKKLSAAAQQQVALLNRQIAALRAQLARIAAALEVSEAKSREQGAQIVNLGKRLNAALASKVEELSRYRSEFFGKLREALGNQKDIRIVGDRFVFQSEVLFASGSAELQPGGQQQIEHLATTLKEIAGRIPKDVDWVLRVDGHTDRIPISTPKFPSNWALSTGRAISVVRQLIAFGVPPDRLAATGFGEFQPIDAGDNREAFRRNRRIEFKLTGR